MWQIANASSADSTVAYLKALIAKTEESAQAASAHDRDIASLHAQLVLTTEAARKHKIERQARQQQLQQQYQLLAQSLHEQHQAVHQAQMKAFKKARASAAAAADPTADASHTGAASRASPLLPLDHQVVPAPYSGFSFPMRHLPPAAHPGGETFGEPVWTPTADFWLHGDVTMQHASDPVEEVVAISPHEGPTGTPAIDMMSESGNSLMHLQMCKSLNVLQVIEQHYQDGTLCAAGVRQQLMWIVSSLQPIDQSDFLEQFRHLPLPGIVRSLYSCRHYDIHNVPSLPCCPLRAPPEWGGRAIAEARTAAHTDPECVMLHPESRKALEQAQADGLVPANHQIAVALIPDGEGVDLSPSEPAEDDIDGVARMRFTMLFRPSDSALKKRKLIRESTAAEKLSSELDATLEKLARMEMDPREHMNRSLQINKAAERLTGYTQSELRLLILDCSPSNPWTQIRVGPRARLIEDLHEVETGKPDRGTHVHGESAERR